MTQGAFFTIALLFIVCLLLLGEMVTHLNAQSKCPGDNENLKIILKSGESPETAGQRQNNKFQGNTHTYTHTHTHTQFLRKEYLVRSILKDTLFIAIVTECARATLIYLFKSAQPVYHISMEVLSGQDFSTLCSLLCFWCLELCLAHSMSSMNICRITE